MDTRPLLAPGAVEVRLLTASPRLVGLRRPLPSNRYRRATEMVAYLTVHHPAPVTGDRLRTRVLGSAEEDAAAKTLFNVAGAARAAMGTAPDGTLLLPRATAQGWYRVGPAVTADVTRAEALCQAAERAGAPEDRMAYWAAALRLVEGEPLAAVRAGYDWWTMEGHESRLAATLVDAACRLAEVAPAHRHVPAALDGLVRARCLDPYSERLTQAAMRLAASIGDVDRLRREWSDCRRRNAALEPGGVPAEETALLHRALCGGGRRAGGYASLAAMDAAPRSTGYASLAAMDAAPRSTGYASLAAMDAAPRSTVPSAPAAL